MNFIENHKTINDFNLYIFDLDGTIIDTEYFHYLSYLESLSSILTNEILTYELYEEIAHSLDVNEMFYFLKYRFGISKDQYEIFYQNKQKIYINNIINGTYQIEFCKGIPDFIQQLIQSQKEFVIVTNSSQKHINHFLEIFPILKNASKIYTKDLVHHKKPHPEGYLHVLQDFPESQYPHKIGFEDSLRGFSSLLKVPHIFPVLIHRPNYSNLPNIMNLIENMNPNTNPIITTSINELSGMEIKIEQRIENQIINNMIQKYISEINKNTTNIQYIINTLSILINNRHHCSHIYLTGMGKSGYICKKSASTWQSLSLPCTYLDMPNLPHGDFGILKEYDMIIFISNSGNTEEIVWILKYLKNQFHKKIMTISIVANQNSAMETYSDFTFQLQNIQEADNINMTPSISSSLFMMVLDMVGIHCSQNITRELFKMNHPAGSLGKI